MLALSCGVEDFSLFGATKHHSNTSIMRTDTAQGLQNLFMIVVRLNVPITSPPSIRSEDLS
jgi:hypothetical protein